MKEQILKIKIELPESYSSILIEKRDNYYVAEWKDCHYELKDIVIECKEIIKVIEEFNNKYN